MAYNDAMNSLKNALNSYSEDEQKLLNLYAKARSNLNERYTANKSALDADYTAKRNEAAADVLREERNLNNLLANRGLAFSGEAAQAKLNSSLSLNDRLSKLARANIDANNALDLGYNDDNLLIDKEESGKLAEIFEKRNKLQGDIADLELKREQANANISASKALKASADGNSSDATSGDESGDVQKLFQPNTTAKDLAKQLIKSATGKDTVTDINGYEKVGVALEEILSQYDLSDDYINDLMFALMANGYTEMSAGTPKKYTTETLISDSRKFYETLYNRYHVLMQLDGKSEGDAIGLALQYAQKKLLEYVYDRTYGASGFRNICLELGINEVEIKRFLAKKHAEKTAVERGYVSAKSSNTAVIK